MMGCASTSRGQQGYHRATSELAPDKSGCQLVFGQLPRVLGLKQPGCNLLHAQLVIAACRCGSLLQSAPHSWPHTGLTAAAMRTNGLAPHNVGCQPPCLTLLAAGCCTHQLTTGLQTLLNSPSASPELVEQDKQQVCQSLSCADTVTCWQAAN